MRDFALVFLGGGVGSILRYTITLISAKYNTTTFPLGTFITNILACFLLGLFLKFLTPILEQDKSLKFLLITGFCGGFSTFSTFSAETIELFQNGNYTMGIFYVLSSIVLGCLAVYMCFKLF